MKVTTLILFFLLVAALAIAFSVLFFNSRDYSSSQDTSPRKEALPIRHETATSSIAQQSKTQNQSVQTQKPQKLIPTPAVTVKPTAPERVLPPAPPPPPALSDQEFYARFARSVIQIFCVNPDEYLSASGVIVGSDGLVLTNAHVADVIQRVGADHCEARHSNPAEAFANLSVVFRPSSIVKIVGTSVPQYDFAFLKLQDWRESFAVASLTLDMVDAGTTVRTLGYPSEFLESTAASNNSNLVFSTLAVSELADFDDDLKTADGYVFQGGIALQQGSSGTPIFSMAGDVLGLIFATTRATTTATREGVAIMTSAIDLELKRETGEGLVQFIKER